MNHCVDEVNIRHREDTHRSVQSLRGLVPGEWTALRKGTAACRRGMACYRAGCEVRRGATRAPCNVSVFCRLD